ncbi:hypothetical protein [Noviherbaspirillum galbum]|uniref:Uncharacterized protein n=1 Tax=Noviherbaspirillum galbum TaxID=2709383 RepID=A0A6B3SFU8_9BURK|nr:hypothetical protein [Noviherbaspirillum galbum]NEX59480.1 hypothetical protein [Noviherbaspirillum galbum]
MNACAENEIVGFEYAMKMNVSLNFPEAEVNVLARRTALPATFDSQAGSR